MSAKRDLFWRQLGCVLALVLALVSPVVAHAGEEQDVITSEDCSGCHETGARDAVIANDLARSVHAALECLDCHAEKGTMPHAGKKGFEVGQESCRLCHEKASAEYTAHGRSIVGELEDLPRCMDCHGAHDILPASARLSRTHPLNLPATCGRCHQDLDLTVKHDIRVDRPADIYEGSVHGTATRDGVYDAATCNDCHSAEGTAHKILSPAYPESSVNHRNIPKTCGRCHEEEAKEFWDGIHGKLVRRGEVSAPVCTRCHGEHGIISPSDPRSPVSRARLAEQTCEPCHESTVLNERYDRPLTELYSFIDSYHGLKAKAGDTHVANCASCHGVHKILPSSDPQSTVHPANLQSTCGECHPGISQEIASAPIHDFNGKAARSPVANIVEKIYIVFIVVVVAFMVLHWAIDFGRKLVSLLGQRSQVVRMRRNEVWQHAVLMATFIVLVISGFALRFGGGWVARFFFGWEGGFELRGLVHRITAVIFSATAVWHCLYLVLSRRGRGFVRDMLPRSRDAKELWHKILFDLGRRDAGPRHGRFSYVEKAEYWALVWGTVIMIGTGILLWFDNWFVGFLPRAALDVALVVHYWEAWLATLAILVWHLYSTVFNPRVYPMNPAWLTGKMPESMYRHEHPEHFEKAKGETRQLARKNVERPSAAEKKGRRRSRPEPNTAVAEPSGG